MRSLGEVNVEGKKVLLRADLDVPLKDGKVADSARIKAAVPTIFYLSNRKAKVIIAAHLDRPHGRVVESLRMDPVAEELGDDFTFLKKLNDCVGERVRKTARELEEGGILLLENLRFHSGEEENSPEFAKRLASLADLYVNDCFSASHRKHASLVGVPKHLPALAGFGLRREVERLRAVLVRLRRPLVVVLGGAKKGKLSLLPDFLKLADSVLVGGKLARQARLKGRGAGSALVVGRGGRDLDEKSVGRFTEIIDGAKTIIWGGPMGAYEDGYTRGTKKIAEAIVKSGALSVVGGGDTVALLGSLGLTERFSLVSTAGGAMLEFLAKGTLPGLAALGYKKGPEWDKGVSFVNRRSKFGLC